MSDGSRQVMAAIEWVGSMVFTAEFALRCLSCPRKVAEDGTDEGILISQGQFWSKSFTFVDILAVLPFWLETLHIIPGGSGGSFVFVRIVRLVRLARILR
eukprot:gene11177-18032_t